MQLNKIQINYEADLETNLQNRVVDTLNKNGAINTKLKGNTIYFNGASAFKNTSLNPLVGITEGEINVNQNKINVELTCQFLIYFYIILALMCISFFVFVSQFENSLKSYLVQFGFTILLFGSYFYNRFFIYSKFKSMLKGI